MKRLVTVLVSLMLMLPLSASASILCVPDDLGYIIGDYQTVFHPNIADSIGSVAGTFNVLIDCTTPTLAYCLEEGVPLCYPAEYHQGPDPTSGEITWILSNYYPYVPGMPSELATAKERGAAVQLAIWHFNNGIDISTGGIPVEIFDAARAIVAAAMTAAPTPTPTTLVLTPPYTDPIEPGTPVTVTATVYDQNGLPMPGVPAGFDITHGGGSGSGVTDPSGQFAVTWTESDTGYDVITFTVDYTIPVGLVWEHPECQDLIQAVEGNGTISESWGDSNPVSTEETSWGAIKNMHR